LAIGELGPLSSLQQAQISRLRAQMEFVRSRGGGSAAPQVSDTAPALLEAAKRLEAVDDYSARETYLEAIAAIMYAARVGEPGALADAAAAARAAVSRETDLRRPVDFLLKGFAERITGGVSAGFGPLRVALEQMSEHARSDDNSIRRWLAVPAFPIL